jgi:1-acyl-sn-glycerol-3-phosphate acyltransferase
MNFKRIDKWSLRYQLLRYYVKLAHNIFFYRKITITGKDNIPEKTPLFFAPNHQNALMDALIILCNIKQQPVFIARADIFKNPVIARILILFKILPAYRIRDGKENLGKNEEIFDISVKILENRNILTLFPETTHTDKRRLQTLKKGVQRIVFQAEEKNGFKLGVKVIPIGINFANYWNFRSDILINFGKPIDLDEYNEIYKANPQKGMLSLRDRLSDELLPLMIHIRSIDYYELNDFARKTYNDKMLKKLNLKADYYNRFKAEKAIISALDKAELEKPEDLADLNQKIKEYTGILKELDIKDWVVRKNASMSILITKSLSLIPCFPLFLFGWINHFFAYYLPNPIRKKIKDKQFLSSINLVTGLILYPLFYSIQFILVWFFTDVWWFKFVYLFTLPFAGLSAFNIHRLYVKTKAQWKFYYFRKKSESMKIIHLKNTIDEILNKITNDSLFSKS